jgi:phage replication-related protein YjqB (UPF0714/DUF867 family)
MAPHGGGIEPGTTEIADAVAGDDHTFYTFSGLKTHGNAGLHITSSRFDEPIGIEIAKQAETVLSIHGCRDNQKFVSMGGRNKRLKKDVGDALRKANFVVVEMERFPGQNPDNICNRSCLGMGVQLEISSGLRTEIFPEHRRGPQESQTMRFRQFVHALRHALAKHAGNPNNEL